MAYQVYIPLSALSAKLGISERAMALRARISRSALRKISAAAQTLNLQSIISLASFLRCRVQVLVVPEEEIFSDYSSIAVALKVEQDGKDSWKIHFMDLVDEFRRTLDPRLILLPPSKNFDPSLTALLASIVSALCMEAGLSIPPWAAKRYFLDKPWFVSESEALKASALVESSLPFRRNNIFVHDNFLHRA